MSMSTDRATLLNESREWLRTIDEVTLAASQATMAVKVDRLLESAVEQYICYDREDCDCTGASTGEYKVDLFKPLCYGADADLDALAYEKRMGIRSNPRVDWDNNALAPPIF